MSAVESFAQALLYAEKFSRANHGWFPYLPHQIGTQGGRRTGFYCPECDPAIERQQYRAADVQHLKACEFRAFSLALEAAMSIAVMSEFRARPQAR